MTCAQIEINGWTVWCEIFGTGSMPLLMIPGSIGTGLTDFYYQIQGEDSLDLSQFTIVCIELLGWGRSRPPLRIHGSDVYKIDSECCIKLMQSLGYHKFSVLGWSEGARVGLVLTQLYPDAILNLILLGIISFQTEFDTINIVNITKDVNKWNQRTVDNYLRVYEDRDEIQRLWARHMTFIGKLPSYFPKGITEGKFSAIICPVLIIHGQEVCQTNWELFFISFMTAFASKDPIISLDHALYVLNKIKHAQIEKFPNGSHNLHHKYRREFKQIVENFLLKTNKIGNKM